VITVHLITKNNADVIEKTLASLAPLDQILVGDLGSADATTKICQRYGATVVHLDFDGDYSAVRNQLAEHSETEWNFYLNPGETLVSGHHLLKEKRGGNAYYAQVFQGKMISKEVRLWREVVFENPVFEGIFDESGSVLDIIIYSPGNEVSEETVDLVMEWKEHNPSVPEVHYYESCIWLSKQDYKKYLACAEKYLFCKKTGISSAMTTYYSGLVRLYSTGKVDEAIRAAVTCLAVKPLMAEFWCLLGDAYYKIADYERAREFYDNAILLGNKRPMTDLWPIDIRKYGEHPSTMIKSCTQMLGNTKYIASTAHQSH